MRFLAHLSGGHPTLPAAEFRALFETLEKPFSTLREERRFLDGHSEVFADEIEPHLPRLGLSKLVCYYLFEGRIGEWPQQEVECCLPPGLAIAARAVRIAPTPSVDTARVEKEIGAVLIDGRKVRLEAPDVVVRAFLLEDRIVVGRQVWTYEPKLLRRRHVENRPNFSPVSLEPKLARALINLSRARPGATVFDPFCGTGGVLLEAAEMGLRAVGSDLDPDMVAGSVGNLAHFGLERNALVFEADVSETPARLAGLGIPSVEAIVTDLPYGRSSSTHRETTGSLYPRAYATIREVLAPGGHAVVGVPNASDIELGSDQLRLVESYQVRVHRSLTRHIGVFRHN